MCDLLIYFFVFKLNLRAEKWFYNLHKTKSIQVQKSKLPLQKCLIQFPKKFLDKPFIFREYRNVYSSSLSWTFLSWPTHPTDVLFSLLSSLPVLFYNFLKSLTVSDLTILQSLHQQVKGSTFTPQSQTTPPTNRALSPISSFIYKAQTSRHCFLPVFSFLYANKASLFSR